MTLALGGHVVAEGPTGRRRIGAADFFTGPNRTALAPAEVAVELVLPPAMPRTGSAWIEVSRRSGDLPVAGVAAVVGLDPSGECRTARGWSAPMPARFPFDAAEQVGPLLGEALDSRIGRCRRPGGRGGLRSGRPITRGPTPSGAGSWRC